MSRRRPARWSLTPVPDLTPFPTADQIAARAHQLFVSGGRCLSAVPDYWRKAEEELLEEAVQRTLARLAP